MKKLIILLTMMLTVSSLAQNVTPANQTRTSATQPLISVRFGQPARNARVWVDGQDMTRYARTNINVVSLNPPHPLNNGVHQVQVKTANGQQKSWSFFVANKNNGKKNGNNGNNGNNSDWNNNGPNRNGSGNNNNGQWNNNNNNNNNGQWNNNGNTNGQWNNNNNGNRIVDVSRYSPSPGSIVTVPNPNVAIAFNGPVQNLRLVVDGRDVTGEATVGNEGISWVPRTNLNRGQHSVQVTGNAQNGQAVSGDFNFAVQY